MGAIDPTTQTGPVLRECAVWLVTFAVMYERSILPLDVDTHATRVSPGGSVVFIEVVALHYPLEHWSPLSRRAAPSVQPRSASKGHP